MSNRVEQLLGGALARWVETVCRWAVLVLVIATTITAAALYYTAGHLGINTDTAEMLSPELPFRKNLQRYKRAFPQQFRNLLVVIDATVPEHAQRFAEALAQRMRAETQWFETVYAPGQGEFFERNALLYLDRDELESLTDRLAEMQPFLAAYQNDPTLAGFLDMLNRALDQQEIRAELAPVLDELNTAVRAQLDAAPYQVSWQRMMRPDRADDTRAVLVVRPHVDYSELLAAGPAIERVRALARKLPADRFGQVRVRLTGSVALQYEELHSVRQGAEWTALAAVSLIIVVLLFGLRSIRLMLSTLLTLLSGLALTGAFAAAVVGQLNLISIAFAVLYIGLAVDFAIHFCLRYQELVRDGNAGSGALRGAARDVGTSVTLCALSTAVGFYAFVPTDFAGVSELGLISGTGMLISLLAGLTILPALLHVQHLRRAARAWPGDRHPVARALSGLISRHASVVRASGLLVGVAALALVPQASFDYNLLNLRDPGSESVAAYRDLLAESETPPQHLTALAPNGEAARALARRAETLEPVRYAVTVYDFVPKQQTKKLALIHDLTFLLGSPFAAPGPSSAAPPERTVAALEALRTRLAGERQTAGLYGYVGKLLDQWSGSPEPELRRRIAELRTRFLGTLPAALERLALALRASPVRFEDLPPELVQRWIGPNDIHRVAIYPQQPLDNNAALREFVTAVQEVAPEATDRPAISLAAGDAAVAAFTQAFLSALIAIALLLAVVLRDPVHTALILVPLLLGSLLTTAATVVLDVPFNFANIIALPLLLGIGVDNGIHMVERWRHGLPVDGDLLGTSTARAVYYSALTTVFSFGTLAFSAHQGMASMGVILTVGVLCMLVSALLVLPTWLGLCPRT